MEIINLCERPSLVSQFMAELRDAHVQQDRLRFRTNVRRLGQIIAYEISQRLQYRTADTVTPLGIARTQLLSDQVVLATILRAGLPFHEGLLSYLDNAENAFVSAYRKYRPDSDEVRKHFSEEFRTEKGWKVVVSKEQQDGDIQVTSRDSTISTTLQDQIDSLIKEFIRANFS